MVRIKHEIASAALTALSLFGGHAGVLGQDAAPDRAKFPQPEEPRTKAIHAKLTSPVTLDGFEPNTPFKDALGFLQERYGFKITFDHKALEASGVKDLGETPVKLPK